MIHDKFSVLRKKSLNCLSMLQKGHLWGLQRIQIKYVQFQVAAKPGCAEAESVRLGQERPSSSSPSVKRRSHDGVRAPQCTSMPAHWGVHISMGKFQSGFLKKHIIFPGCICFPGYKNIGVELFYPGKREFWPCVVLKGY